MSSSQPAKRSTKKRLRLSSDRRSLSFFVSYVYPSFMSYPIHLLKVINALKRLPGVGTKSAERYAFHLLSWPDNARDELATAVSQMKEHLKRCEHCGCLTDSAKCAFCDPTRRNQTILCIVASPKEVFSVEDIRQYTGLYHVLGTTLSPLEGRGPQRLLFDKLKKRIQSIPTLKEIIVAFDSTIEGDATALYLKRELEGLKLIVSRLAFGLPMGSALEFVDGGTLAKAFAGRRAF